MRLTDRAAALAAAALGAAAVARAEAAAPLLQDGYTETVAVVPALVLLFLLAIIVHVAPCLRAEHRRTMRVIIAVVLSLVAQNFLEYRLAARADSWLGRTLASVYGYAVRPVILVLFLRLIAPKMRLGWAWALAGLNAAVNATALFSPVCFRIEDNHYVGGPLSHMCLWVSAALLACLLVTTLRAFQPQKRRENWLPLLVLLLILGGVALDYNVEMTGQPISYLTIAVVISCMVYCLWLHTQLAWEHEKNLQAEQRVQIMMTQIQPHFLYNTLATIRALCRRDADKAGEVVEKFGAYLRRNLDSLGISGLIPFRKELEHTKIYVEIEMVRFDNIRVRYDIGEDRFDVPPLTLQPLVENAIRHGVRIREAGIVEVATRRRDGRIEITVRDNGAGFDVGSIQPADGTHIGIQNVRERIERMCGGTLTVQSAPGEGTTVTIAIPARDEPDGVEP